MLRSRHIQLCGRILGSTIQKRIDLRRKPMPTFRNELIHMVLATAIFFGIAFASRLI